MSTKNNSGTDIDVLTNFQPMPKRFMVWDKETEEFWYDLGDYNLVFGDEIRLGLWLANRKEVHGLNLDRFIIVQSTNLFDKDGKEIFEGSIICDYDDEIGVVYYDSDKGQCRARFTNGDDSDMESPSLMKIIGHSLSNPGLLEEK